MAGVVSRSEEREEMMERTEKKDSAEVVDISTVYSEAVWTDRAGPSAVARGMRIMR